jgi:hypothetical protein
MISHAPKRRYGTGITINCHSYREIIRERDPNDQWSGQDTDSHHTIDGIFLTPEYRFPDVVSEIPIEKGKQYFLVYALYSTGDSFSHDSGCLFYIDLFDKIEKAEKCKQSVFAHYRNYKDDAEYHGEAHCRQAGYESPTQGMKTVHVPWIGYFESLQEIIITPVQVIK